MTDTTRVQSFFLLGFIVIVAAVFGYRRGALREALTFGVLAILVLILNTPALSAVVIAVLQLFVRLFRVIWSRMSAITDRTVVAQSFADLQNQAVIQPNQEPVALFLVFLFGVLFAYRVSGQPALKKLSKPSFGGALLGMVNAYIVAAVLLPVAPRGVPGPEVLSNQSALRTEATNILNELAKSTGVVLGPDFWMFTVVAVVIVIMCLAVS